MSLQNIKNIHGVNSLDDLDQQIRFLARKDAVKKGDGKDVTWDQSVDLYFDKV